MKTIDKKIIEKIYRYETKKTAAELIFKTAGIIFLGFSVIIVGQVIIEIIKEQSSLDIFALFTEDFEVIGKYFFDTIYVFYLEIPKILIILWLLLLSLLSLLTVFFIRNFTKIKNKLKSLFKFWKGE